MKLLFFSILTISALIPQAIAQRGGLPGQRIEDPIPRELEIMYTRGLKYLASTQDPDGSWGKRETYASYPGTVALCMLAFLAHGDDPNHGPYATNIKKSINYLLSRQQKNGYIGSTSTSDRRGNMYNHGFATLALAEAYGMVEDKKIGPALKKAVDLILSSQKRNRRGAWRYSPDDQDADSTVAGCQIVALFAARNAGIPVPDEALTKALKYMESCRNKSDGSYGYTSPNGGRPTLTAIGLLCQALAKEKDTEAFKKSFGYLVKKINHRETHYPFYYEYYMSQALFQANEATWKEWNKKNIKLMKILQQPDGSFTSRKGSVFSTSAGLLSLALNYRFLPIYEK